MLKDTIKKEDKNNILVLGIPRAGALTANIVSKKLSIPNFDLIIPRKLTDPDNKEQAIGAIIEDGFEYILHELIKDFDISEGYLEDERKLQLKEINRRKEIYSRGTSQNSVTDKIRKYNTILVIDDGIASGATMMVTGKWINQLSQNQSNYLRRLILAAPVASKNITNLLLKECTAEVEVVFHPSQTAFHSVEQYHQNFDMITDEQVVKIMEERGL